MSTAQRLAGEDLTLRIGEVAQLARVTTRTLRYWEEIGLLAPSRSGTGGERLYETQTLDRVNRIRDLQELLGFSLEEVRVILDADDLLDRLRFVSVPAGVRTEGRRRLLDEAIAANDRLIARLDDTLGRIEHVQAEELSKERQR